MRSAVTRSNATRQGPSAGADDVTVSEGLARYGEEHAPDVADAVRIGYAIDALDARWGDLTVWSISKDTRERYAAERGVSPGTVRREPGALAAARNHCNGTLVSGVPATWLPPRPPGRERRLSRDETAKPIRAARADLRTRHLARFILIAYHTGSRKAVILALEFRPTVAGAGVDTVNVCPLPTRGQDRRDAEADPTRAASPEAARTPPTVGG